MLTLLVMRHGKAEQREGVADRDRRLTGRGKADVTSVAKELVRRGVVPDTLIYSAAARAKGTARCVAEVLSGGPRRLALDGLYGAASAQCLELIRHFCDSRVAMVIGHNPGLEDLVAALTGEVVPLSTSSVACLDLDLRAWGELDTATKASLRWVIHARSCA